MPTNLTSKFTLEQRPRPESSLEQRLATGFAVAVAVDVASAFAFGFSSGMLGYGTVRGFTRLSARTVPPGLTCSTNCLPDQNGTFATPASCKFSVFAFPGLEAPRSLSLSLAPSLSLSVVCACFNLGNTAQQLPSTR